MRRLVAFSVLIVVYLCVGADARLLTNQFKHKIAPLAPVLGQQATAANTFLGSIGINIHIAQGFSEAAYEPEFTFTGIRNARDAYTSSSLVTLHNNTASSTYPGVKMDILADAPSTIVAEGNALVAAGAFMGAEGPNEPNNFSFSYSGTNCGGAGTWLGCAQFQRDLYTAVKGSALSSYPVFSVSETGGETDNVGLQCLILNSSCSGASAVTLMAANTQYADYANIHNYVQGNGACGVFSSIVANQAWQAMDPLLNSCWDGFYGDQIVTWAGHFNGYTTGQVPGVGRMTSETGWDSSTTGSTVDYQGKIDELTYLDGFKRGNAFTFIYEMVDAQGSTGNQGLYDSNNVAKLGATYIHNLTTILQDTANFSPGALNYSIASEPSTVHDMLLQKANGDFYLVVWSEQTTSTGGASFNVGYTTIPGTSGQFALGTGSTFENGGYTMPQTGVLQSVSYYAAGATGGNNFLGVYQDNGSNKPATLLATSAPSTLAAGWNTLAMTTTPTITSGTKIWFALLPVSVSPTFRNDAGQPSNTSWYDTAGSDTTLPAPFAGTNTFTNSTGGLYATFNTTGPVTVTLGSAANVTIYDTTMGTTPIAATTNTASIPLTLSDHAVILQISAAPLAPAFYVSTTGNDSNAGTLASPFLTLHQCKTSMEASGTKKTCYVRGGSYAPAAADASICSGTTTCAVGLSSTSDNGLTFSYYPPDGYDSADITGGSTTDGTGLWDIFWVGNTTGVTINGLKLHNFNYAGIDSGGGAHALTVKNNEIYNGICVYTVGSSDRFMRLQCDAFSCQVLRVRCQLCDQ